MNHPLSRRALLSRTVAAAGVGAAAALAATPVAAAATRRQIPRHKISIQLYTLRGLMDADLEGTLAELSAIGYRTVELAGLHGRTPAEFRRILDRHGLNATSSHVSLDGDIDAALADARTLGNRYLVVPYADHDTADGWRALADRLNEAGEAARAAGMQVGYHNHDHEFGTVEGQQPYTILTERTDPRLVHLELDLYWAVAGGQDPVGLIRRHGGRVRQLHVKDRAAGGEMTAPGTGTIDFPTIFAAAHTHGVREYVVEHDHPADALHVARVGFDYLDHVRF